MRKSVWGRQNGSRAASSRVQEGRDFVFTFSILFFIFEHCECTSRLTNCFKIVVATKTVTLIMEKLTPEISLTSHQTSAPLLCTDPSLFCNVPLISPPSPANVTSSRALTRLALVCSDRVPPLVYMFAFSLNPHPVEAGSRPLQPVGFVSIQHVIQA